MPGTPSICLCSSSASAHSVSIWRYINRTWLLYKILSLISMLCKSPTHISSAAWMQMTEVCVCIWVLFTCGCEWARQAVASDSPNGLLTPRISDLESISHVNHRRSICDTHPCARHSGGTSAQRFRCLWPGMALPPLGAGLPCSAQPVCVINSHWVMDERRV